MTSLYFCVARDTLVCGGFVRIVSERKLYYYSRACGGGEEGSLNCINVRVLCLFEEGRRARVSIRLCGR